MDVSRKVSQLLWDSRLNDADTLLKPLIETKNSNSNSIKSHHNTLLIHCASLEVSLWRVFLVDSIQAPEEALRRLDAFEEVVDNISSYHGFPPFGSLCFFSSFGSDSATLSSEAQLLRLHSQIVYGELHTARAFVLFSKGNYVTGAVSARKGWNYFRKSQKRMFEMKLEREEGMEAKRKRRKEREAEEVKKFSLVSFLISRVHFGLALFNYGVTLVPPSLSWVVTLLGIQADPKLALDSLRKSADLDTPRSTAACVLLIVILWLLDQEEKKTAVRKTKELLRKLPNSSVLWCLSAGFQRHLGNLEESSAHYQTGYECSTQLPQFQHFLNYELGHNDFLQLKFQEAVPRIEDYLRNSTSPYFKAYGIFKLGFCYWMLGRKDEVSELYTTLEDHVQPDFAYDAYALRKSREFLKRKEFTNLEQDVIQASLLVEALLFSEAQEVLSRVEAQFKTIPLLDRIEETTYHHYLQGLVASTEKEEEEALRYLEEGYKIGKKAKREKWVASFCCVELAELLLEEGMEMEKEEKERRRKKAAWYVKEAKDKSGYDFYKQAQMRIVVLERRLQIKET